jgi:hypothetical protein
MCWATNISGGNNYEKVWDDNNWEKGDALLGYYFNDDDTINRDCYKVIYSPPDSYIYILAHSDSSDSIHVPNTIIVSYKNISESDLSSDTSTESDAESETCSETDGPFDDTSFNDRILNMFLSCVIVDERGENNKFKQEAFMKAYNTIKQCTIPIYTMKDIEKYLHESELVIGEGCLERICDLLDGIPISDIIHTKYT